MIETIDVEIYLAEKNLLNRKTIQYFMDKIGGYLVAVDHGVYCGYLNLQMWQRDCRQDIIWKKEKVILNEQMFVEARIFYSHSDKTELLPVVNEDGKVLTFLQWNEQQERNDTYLEKVRNKIIDLLIMGEYIELRNWDEYTHFYYTEVKKEGWNLM